jgi:hypothetical protein
MKNFEHDKDEIKHPIIKAVLNVLAVIFLGFSAVYFIARINNIIN